MPNNWFFFSDLDELPPYILPTDALVSHSFGSHLFSQISSLVDDSLYQFRYLYVPGSIALQGTFNCISKFTGAMLFWWSSSNLTQKISQDFQPGSCKSSIHIKNITSSRHTLLGFHFTSRSKRQSATPVVLGKISSFTMKYLFKEVEKLKSFPVLSLAAALVPSFDNISSEALADTQQNTDVLVHGCMTQRPCEVEHRGCDCLPFPDRNWTRLAVEPKTGIEFPMILDNILAGEHNSTFTSEVLVGTGSRTMKIIKIKSLKVYAFGFYVHPYSLCEKLGPKYASIPVGELNKLQDFYQDLLREDISMTIRFVVSCNGMKINSVKDAFEKSLRARLVKTNPDTDYLCLSAFGSCFTQDIPLPAGTTIDFRRTADGQLITEIGGSQIGRVRSKDLCRAFFDMYIGDVPVSEQTKEEIGKNVASIMKRC